MIERGRQLEGEAWGRAWWALAVLGETPPEPGSEFCPDEGDALIPLPRAGPCNNHARGGATDSQVPTTPSRWCAVSEPVWGGEENVPSPGLGDLPFCDAPDAFWAATDHFPPGQLRAPV